MNNQFKYFSLFLLFFFSMWINLKYLFPLVSPAEGLFDLTFLLILILLYVLLDYSFIDNLLRNKTSFSPLKYFDYFLIFLTTSVLFLVLYKLLLTIKLFLIN